MSPVAASASPEALLSFLFVLVFAPGAIRNTVRTWRTGGQREPAEYWAGGARSWLAWERSTIPAIAGFLLGIGPIMLAEILELEGTAHDVVSFTGFAFFAASGLLMFTCAFFRFPSWLIYRNLRGPD